MKMFSKIFLGGALAALTVSVPAALLPGNLPLWFETGATGNFIAHANGAEFSVTPAGAEFALAKAAGGTADCRVQFLGANPQAHISGAEPLAGTVNYLFGGEAGAWRTGVNTFAQVQAREIYPGVDVVYYGNQQKLEYDLNLAAGVNPSVIALRFDGAKKITATPQGELVVTLSDGEVVQHAPVAYQIVDGTRQEVAANYKITGADTVAFAVENFNRALPLVIDPVLSYAGYFGGNNKDIGWAIAVNQTDGSIYVAGETFSSSFGAVTPNALQRKYRGGSLSGDAFVARFDVDGTGTNLSLHYATYLGGSGNDAALGVAVDAAGDAFVTGFTDSANFPTTKGLFPKIKGPLNSGTKSYATDAFVTELNPDGTGLVYSTYLGGSSMDAAYGIALDDAGNAYVAGYTYSTNFPVTPAAFQKHLACPPTLYINANAFVAEINADGTALNYSTYLGGTNFDEACGITYKNGRVFVAGHTVSYNFPNINGLTNISTATGPIAKLLKRDNKAFVTAFDNSNVTNLSLLYSAILGGTNYDTATGVAADVNGSAYICGCTTSRNFPNTATNVPGLTNGFIVVKSSLLLVTNGLVTNAFLTRIDFPTGATNATIGYSAVFGGSGSDLASGVNVDANNEAFVIGTSRSGGFPTNNTGGFLVQKNKASWPNTNSADVFVIGFNSDCTSLLYSGCLGGKGADSGNAIAADPLGNVYLTGQTASKNFPVTTNALQKTLAGSADMFVVKISATNSTPAPQLAIGGIPVAAATGQAKAFRPASHGISLKWQMFPANANYGIETSPSLNGGNWCAVTNRPAYSNGWYNVTLPVTNSGVQFFRLHRP
jgi:Beta-propeller repeat